MKSMLMVTFWILGAAFSMSNIVHAMDNLTSENNIVASSSSSTFDSNKAYLAATALETEVELTISAKKLDGPLNNRGTCLKPDPMCTISIRNTLNSTTWKEYERTEFLADNRNPEFAKKILIPYSSFHEKLNLLFTLYTYYFWGAEAKQDLHDHTLLGYASCNLADLLHEGRMESKLKATRIDTGKVESVRGRVIVHAEKLTNCHQKVALLMTGTKLARKGLFAKLKPYIEIYKQWAESKEYVLVHRTEVVHQSTNPQWEPIVIPLERLCNGDYDRKLKFVCWSYREYFRNRTGRKLVGQFYATLSEIADRNTQPKRTFALQNPRHLLWKESGQLEIDFSVVEAPSFAHFIRAGLQIHCVVAIDFSKSNGNPSTSDSLHYRDVNNNATSLTQYEKALISVVDLLGDYDWDKGFSFLGFGDRLRDAVNNSEIVGDDDYLVHSTNCSGIEDALDAYRKHLAMFEPANTDFKSLLQTISSVVKTRDAPENYFILFILTPGSIPNVDEVERIISEASTLPVSIILLGIGDGLFSSVQTLTKEKIEDGNRNIVHFLPFSDCRQYADDDNARSCMATKLLAELPAQVLSYMQSKNYTPNNIPQKSFQPAEPLFPSQPVFSTTHPDVPSSSSSNPPLELFVPAENVSSSRPSSSTTHSSDPASSVLKQPTEPYSPIENVSSSSSSRFDVPSSNVLNPPVEPHLIENVFSSSPPHFDIPSDSGSNLPLVPHSPAKNVPSSSPFHSSVPSSNVLDQSLERHSLAENVSSSPPSHLKLLLKSESLNENTLSSHPSSSSTHHLNYHAYTRLSHRTDESPLVSVPSSDVHVTIDSSSIEPLPNVSPQSSARLVGLQPPHFPVTSPPTSNDSSSFGTPTSELSPSSDRGKHDFPK